MIDGFFLFEYDRKKSCLNTLLCHKEAIYRMTLSFS
jgi:hypothetical protein